MRLSPAAFLRVILILLCSTSLLAAKVEPTGTSKPDEVLVKLKPGASQSDVAAIHHVADVDQGKKIASLKSGTLWRLHSRSKNVEALAKALEKNPNVEYVEPNYIVRLGAAPNDTRYAELYALKNTGQVVGLVPGLPGTDIEAEAAWNVTTGSASVVIGVVDTGIDYTHPDLAPNIWNNPGGKGNAACAAGTHGFNAITGTCDPKDDEGHGTHVSGTIGAAGNNSVGVTGVNWTTSIMGLKFLGANGYGNTADAIEAIDFAVQAKIDGVNVRVLSNSWGGGGFSKALLDEINKANDHDILFVAAAGNSSLSNDLYPHYPSSFATANMIAVAATDNRDDLAYFSNYGPTTVHLAAPGVGILSTVPGNTYSLLSGTSMATPHVAGVAALVLAQNPSWTTAQVKSAILNSVEPVAGLSGKCTTGGRLNAARALGVPPSPDFSISITPATKTAVRGSSTTYNVTLTPIAGFAGSVNLSAGLPSGVTGTFSPNPATTQSTLTITTTASMAVGNYGFSVTGTSGAAAHSATAFLNVSPAPFFNPCPSFTSYSVGVGSPQTGAVIGDFNRDGRPDLALAEASANRIVILPGLTAGFSSGYYTYYQGTNTPIAVAAGDLNGDGRMDLITANAANNVSVLLASGDFGFNPATFYTVGNNPFYVAIGDFNRDGKPDLATANNGSGNVSILIGNGDGTFQAAVHYATGGGTYSVSIGDFDADGRSDLAVANSTANKVLILGGNGDGTFATAAEYAAGSGPSAVAVGDLNGDGRLDLAVSNYRSDNVSVLLGNGDRTFQAPVQYGTGQAPSSVVIGDFNADGKPDLASANTESDNASLLFGAGNGAFLAAIHYSTYLEPSQVVAGDFNRDGRTDLVVAAQNSYYGSGYVSVLLNNGTCALNCNTMAPAVHDAAGTTPDAVTAADFNRDGRPDVAVVNQGSNNVFLKLGNADGTFTAGVTVTVGTSPDAVVAGDFDRDGKLDLAVANSGSNHVSIVRGNGDGTFQPAVAYGTATTPRAVATGDFNRDGKLDLAVANGSSDNVSVLLGNGDATFQAAVQYGTGVTPVSVAIGDFNRDGRLDLAVANSGAGTVSILIGNGNGTFQTATAFNAGTTPIAVAIGDFDRDGRADLAVANAGSNNVSVLLGNGTGGFQSAIHSGAGTSPAGLTVADFNDDGFADLAVANGGSNNVSILIGGGGGDFSGVASAVGTSPAAVVAADFNRDGKPDLAVANSGAATLSILLNTCPVPDLSITKTHTGIFTQGDSAKTFTITVTNNGAIATSGTVSVTDTLPAGLLPTAISGTGWACTLAPLTCTRSDALAPGASYPAITITVKVAGSAPASVINTVIVSGGGETNAGNSTASDAVTVAQSADLVITSTHGASFIQGQTGAIYTLRVRNAGGLASSGTVTVTDTLPAGLTAAAISGTGWSCTLATLTCTRSDALASATTYPAIKVTVDVAAGAAASVINTATVSGGGETNSSNNTASDPTIVWSSQTCGGLNAGTSYPLGGPASDVVAGDFNGDGKMDIAAARPNTDQVTLLLGNGDGSLTTGSSSTVGDNPVALAATDLNGDGALDLVTADYYYTISVLLGNGNGTFASAVSYATDTYPRALVIADFDRDGTQDVAVASNYAPSVAIYLGAGDGTLRSPVTYAAVSEAYSLAATDFDNDGNVDLVVPASYGGGGAILLGNGNGTFRSPLTYSGGSSSSSVVTGDFNRDGNADFAASEYYGVWVFLGNGNGTFPSPVFYSAGYSTSKLAAEDFNGDGKTDLFAGSSYYGVSLLLGNGDGTFQSGSSVSAGDGLTRVVITDFNGDGRADLAGPSYYSNAVTVLLNACPDLTITKTHNGQLITGSITQYTITVSNAAGSSVGAVTVTDALPSGLTATFLSGYQWDCTLATLTCTRSTSILGGAYSDITLYALVDASAQQTITNVVTVSGGGDSNNANNSASDTATVTQVADLIITTVHNGTLRFAQGESGRTYTLTVKNIGAAPASGMITASIYLPFVGLAATGLSGPGWSCVLSQLQCTRSDTLAGGTSYAPITLTVDVGLNAPYYVETHAAVYMNGDYNPFNNDDYHGVYVIKTPLDVTATAGSAYGINISWSSVSQATRYQVYRSSNNSPFQFLAEVPGTGLSDTTVQPNTTYIYRLRAGDSQIWGPTSNSDIATTIVFTDEPVFAASTRPKAVHIAELRTAVNAVRAAAGLPPVTFPESVAAGVPMRASHHGELWTALNEARIALGIGALGNSNPVSATGGPIRAAHIMELRAGVK